MRSARRCREPLAVRSDPMHRARRNRADRLALAHHYRQLVELGCASSTARGGVIGRGSFTDGAGRADLIGGEDDAAVIVWHELDAPGVLGVGRLRPPVRRPAGGRGRGGDRRSGAGPAVPDRRVPAVSLVAAVFRGIDRGGGHLVAADRC